MIRPCMFFPILFCYGSSQVIRCSPLCRPLCICSCICYSHPGCQFSRSVMPDPCDPTDWSTSGLPVHHQLLGTCSNPHPLSRWCHPTISSSVVPFSSGPQSFPASGSLQMSQLFASGDASASASVLLKNIQDWFPLGWTGLISFILSLRSFSLQLNSIKNKASHDKYEDIIN